MFANIIQLLLNHCNCGSLLSFPTMTVFLPILAILGALSPLFTLAWLWQLKEWRWDRLLEHLRREGWMGQLWGRTRPAILGMYAAVAMAAWWNGGMVEWRDGQMGKWAVIVALLLLSGLTAVQIGLRRQRRPVFTKKTVTVTATAVLLTILLAIFLGTHHPAWLPILVLLQPLALATAWVLWYPVDTFLKNRIIARARSLREKFPDLTVIGVTGSVGKTTTKELLACVLRDLQPAMTPAHVNSEIGVAQWLMQRLTPPLPASAQRALGEGVGGWGYVIVEMGAYRKGEISTLCSFTKPTIGVITHIGTQHIALFGSQEKLFEAKAELIASLPPDGRAFLNGDNALTRTMAAISSCPTVIVGTGGQCDLEAFDIEETGSGIRFRLVRRSLSPAEASAKVGGEGEARDVLFEVPLHGTHNVTNVLLAIAVGEHLGVRLERMRELLKTFAPLSQTFSVRTEAGVRILDDTHNSSVASMKAAIAWARTQPEEHKILLAAGLIEMGDLQTSVEEELGAIAGRVFERMIILDAASARNFAASGAKNVEVYSKRSEKIEPGSLLVCTGRMSEKIFQSLMP